MKGFWLWLLMPVSLLGATDDTIKPKVSQMQAVRLTEKINIDGVLSEPVWQNGYGVDQFVQREPLEGGEPTEQTIVHICYDDEALYIGARMLDSAPDSIISRLGRRDTILSSDYLAFFIDPYYDRRSGFYFLVNAGGTLCDGVMMNDDWDDDSWDGIWMGEVNIDDKGWTAELRIPYSQLRFQKKNKYVWGINFKRVIERKNEWNYLVFTPKNGSGFVSRFVDLVGIENISPKRQLEVLPYFRSKEEFTHPEQGDPFNDGSRFIPGIGVDVKYGIGSNLTLDLTLNPDFGQVEVDPAVVNLSDVETYFSEKRPFFIEGSTIFNFGEGGARNYWSFNWGNPGFFYSRRIGRAPQGSLPDYDYADVPEGTSILGAAKLSGKIGNNWNIGMIHAVTQREHADIEYDGKKSVHEVEPLSYYGVYRAQKEFEKGRQGLGFISTIVHRDFKNPSLRDELNENAVGLGVDGWTFLDKEKTWVISGWGGLTNVSGTPERMIDLQTSSRHYFQRPDARHIHVDSSMTSLTGFAARMNFNKQKGNVIFNSALGFIDPGFENNDLGYSWRTDIMNGHIGLGYKWTTPNKITRYAEIIGARFRSYDFDENIIWDGYFAMTFLRFLNYYELEAIFAYNPAVLNNRLTRGGPLTKNPSGWELDVMGSTDNRKTWVFGLQYTSYIDRSGSDYREYGVEVEWKPASNLSLSLNPSIEYNYDDAQWIDNFVDATATATFGKRYVFAQLHQKTLSSSIRLNLTFTPGLSFQLYAQPLISSGDYRGFKELTQPKTYDFLSYGDNNSTISMKDNEYYVDPDGSGLAETINWENPDFNYKSLRGNAVLRWEYKLGSVLYFVWTQSRSESEEIGDFRFRKSVNRLLDLKSDNIFMIKWTYWLTI